jgi:hypothetical protein
MEARKAAKSVQEEIPTSVQRDRNFINGLSTVESLLIIGLPLCDHVLDTFG